MNRPLLGLLAGTCLLGCTASQQPARPNHLPDTGTPALHALNDARLRELMDRMNALMFDRFMTQPELEQERRRYTAGISESARQLDATIDALLARLPALQLEPHEQDTFQAIAHKLRNEARTLNDQALQGDTDALPATLERISNTCTACHGLFRKLSH